MRAFCQDERNNFSGYRRLLSVKPRPDRTQRQIPAFREGSAFVQEGYYRYSGLAMGSVTSAGIVNSTTPMAMGATSPSSNTITSCPSAFT